MFDKLTFFNIQFVEYTQCDQIGRNFAIWLLFAWAFNFFYLNKQFQNTVCCTYFNIQKQLDV